MGDTGSNMRSSGLLSYLCYNIVQSKHSSQENSAGPLLSCYTLVW